MLFTVDGGFTLRLYVKQNSRPAAVWNLSKMVPWKSGEGYSINALLFSFGEITIPPHFQARNAISMLKNHGAKLVYLRFLASTISVRRIGAYTLQTENNVLI